MDLESKCLVVPPCRIDQCLPGFYDRPMAQGPCVFSLVQVTATSLTSLQILFLFVEMDVGQNGRPMWDHRCECLV